MANRLISWVLAGLLALILVDAARTWSSNSVRYSDEALGRLWEAAIAADPADEDEDLVLEVRWRDVAGVAAGVAAGVVLLGKVLGWWP